MFEAPRAGIEPEVNSKNRHPAAFHYSSEGGQAYTPDMVRWGSEHMKHSESTSKSGELKQSQLQPEWVVLPVLDKIHKE